MERVRFRRAEMGICRWSIDVHPITRGHCLKHLWRKCGGQVTGYRTGPNIIDQQDFNRTFYEFGKAVWKIIVDSQAAAE